MKNGLINKEEQLRCVPNAAVVRTIKGGSRRAEKSHKVLMMMKAAKLGWAGSGAEADHEQARSRPGAGQEQCKSREEARVEH